VGRDDVGGFLAEAFRTVGDFRLVPTRANRTPAAANYLRAPGDTQPGIGDQLAVSRSGAAARETVCGGLKHPRVLVSFGSWKLVDPVIRWHGGRSFV
jgi:hypothetical protein